MIFNRVCRGVPGEWNRFKEEDIEEIRKKWDLNEDKISFDLTDFYVKLKKNKLAQGDLQFIGVKLKNSSSSNIFFGAFQFMPTESIKFL